MNERKLSEPISEKEKEQMLEELENTDVSSQIYNNVRPEHSSLIFKPQTTWVMKINIKKQKTKPSPIILLVVAEDYKTAKEVAEDFVKKYTEKDVYISNINGSQLKYEYLLKHQTEE